MADKLVEEQQRKEPASTRSCQTQNVWLRWDINFADSLLSVVTPIVLVIIAVLLLLSSSPSETTPKRKNIICTFPLEFPTNWINYGHAKCLSGESILYQESTLHQASSNETIPSQEIDVASLFPPTVNPEEYNVPFRKLILLAVVCLAPVVFWRLVVGHLDGSEFISNTSNEHNGFLKIICLVTWFVITKIGSIVICGILLRNIMSIQTDTQIKDIVNQPLQSAASIPVLCDFTVRRLGANYRRYTVECLVSQSADVETTNLAEYMIGHLMKAVLLWVYGLVIVVVINAASSLVLFLLCLFKSYRIYFIKSKSGKQESSKYSAVDYGLGVSGVMVATLATRNGGGHQVGALMRQLCEELHDA